MDILRTPDDRFLDLPDFPFEPHYATVARGDGSGDLRMHYLDEGPSDGEVVLLLHGEPSWSFLYRTMIPVLVGAGLRCVVPDLVGFGRSDKPAAREDYSFARHVEWMRALLFDHLDLSGVTLVGQDWGGLIGLRLVGEHPPGSPAWSPPTPSCRPVTRTPVTPSSRGSGSPRPCRSSSSGTSSTAAAPPTWRPTSARRTTHPSPTSRSSRAPGSSRLLVPTTPDDPAAEANRAAWEVLAQLDKPFLCAFSDQDPITAGADRVLIARIPGCSGHPHHHRRRRSLPPGGPGPAAGGRDRRLHRCHERSMTPRSSPDESAHHAVPTVQAPRRCCSASLRRVSMVLACGVAVLDVQQTVERLPGPDEKLVANELLVASGGPAANAAVTACRTRGRRAAGHQDRRLSPWAP